MTDPSLSTSRSVLNLQEIDFLAYVSRYCNEYVVKYFELLEIDDIFSLLHEEYLELIDIKKKLTFSRPDGTCVMKLGIQYDIKKLFESFQNTLINNEQVAASAAIREDLVLSSKDIEKYPFLERLIRFFELINCQEPISSQ